MRRRTVDGSGGTVPLVVEASLAEALAARVARTRAPASTGSTAARDAAAIDFLGDAVATFALEGGLDRQHIRAALEQTAAQLDIPIPTLRFHVYRRALASRDAARHSPRLAAEFALRLLVVLDVVEGASLWVTAASGKIECVSAAGDAPRSRRLAAAARELLSGTVAPAGSFAGAMVERWDRPYAALVVRTARGAVAVPAYLSEAAEALSPLLEREALYQEGADRERDLVAAAERRSIRIAFDLHDGPLQELVLLADDLRRTRGQVGSLLEGRQQNLVEGRFDDLEARLYELDRSLRRIVHSGSACATEQPLADTLRKELDQLEEAGIRSGLEIEGDLDDLTDSQRIVLFRVVQEALSNVRRHSRATSVAVAVSGAAGHVTVSVVDDGCGFEPADTLAQARRRGRFGLNGLSERARLLGGDVEIASRLGAGSTIRVTIPRWKPLQASETVVFGVTG